MTDDSVVGVLLELSSNANMSSPVTDGTFDSPAKETDLVDSQERAATANDDSETGKQRMVSQCSIFVCCCSILTI